MGLLRSLLILLVGVLIGGAAVEARAQNASAPTSSPSSPATTRNGEASTPATEPQNKHTRRTSGRRLGSKRKRREAAQSPAKAERNIIERQVKGSKDASTRSAGKFDAPAKSGPTPATNSSTTPPVGVAGGAAAVGVAAAAASASPAKPADTGWSPAEIASAKAHCDVVLKGIQASLTHREPIKEGKCGSPAVVELTALGSGNAAVELSPPALLTCDMVVSLDKWMREDVQPLARKHLGAPVVQIQTMSSYSCRTAYGRKLSRLSEHGRANALDIGGFKTRPGATAMVLTSWGLTVREIKAIAAKAEAKRQAEAAAAAKAAEAQARRARGGTAVGTATGTGSGPSSNSALGLAGGTGSLPTPGIAPFPAGPRVEPLGMSPSRLGGPKSNSEKSSRRRGSRRAEPVEEIPETARISFMREVHARACKHFGTVLGPEANNAHKNHFHLDMAERKRSNFCE
jgi:hypothetical protein